MLQKNGYGDNGMLHFSVGYIQSKQILEVFGEAYLVYMYYTIQNMHIVQYGSAVY